MQNISSLTLILWYLLKKEDKINEILAIFQPYLSYYTKI